MRRVLHKFDYRLKLASRSCHQETLEYLAKCALDSDPNNYLIFGDESPTQYAQCQPERYIVRIGTNPGDPYQRQYRSTRRSLVLFMTPSGVLWWVLEQKEVAAEEKWAVSKKGKPVFKAAGFAQMFYEALDGAHKVASKGQTLVVVLGQATIHTAASLDTICEEFQAETGRAAGVVFTSLIFQ